MNLDEIVTVCGECLRACCYQGADQCETPGVTTKEIPRERLAKIKREPAANFSRQRIDRLRAERQRDVEDRVRRGGT